MANPRHKKARMLRDFMIETNTVNMFKEEEKGETIYFRTFYPFGEERKQVVITVTDNVFLGAQSLIAAKIPEEKRAAVVECINQFNLELPTVKYVLTKDDCVIVSIFFPADEAHFNAPLIMGTVVQVMKHVSQQHYGRLQAVLNS